MRKSLLALTVLGTLNSGLTYAEGTAPAKAETPAYTLTYNVGLYSQYIFRGLTQTANQPAIQGGVDFAHSNGFYLGTWASNVSWLEDSRSYDKASLEWDIYGGYRNAIKDVTYDIGLLQYVYPGDFKSGTGFLAKKAETTEVYGSLAYKWVTAKLSVAVSDGVFGNRDAAGTYYADLTANYPLTDTITITGHIGRQEYSGSNAGVSNDLYSYTDWKLGVSKLISEGVAVGAYYTDTNAKEAGYGKQADLTYAYNGGNIASATGTVFIQKTF
jgi:uncharacterized protein (TIGR02001 family)